MREIQITDKEYDKLIKRLEFFDTMRNNLLTFSFTSVLAVLGVALAMDMNSISAWICLIPFLLIIPFTARISYYRLASAHITSFLKSFGKLDMQFELETNIVREGICKHYKLIAWLINHEMVLLSIATSLTFYLAYILSISEWKLYNYISLLIPVILTALVFIIADSTYSYKKLMDDYSAKWEQYIHEN
jgi:hypothetical protein